MPTLSCWVIRRPRTTRRCEGIYHHYTQHDIPAGTPQVRCFGHAGHDRPFPMYICLDCARASAPSNRKIALALEAFDAET